VEVIKYHGWIRVSTHVDMNKSLTQGWLRVQDGTSKRGP
jgi:hypothetical protein